MLDGQAADPVPVLSGDPQASVLCLFAEHCMLYRSITSTWIARCDPNSLAQWETDWQMKFNVAKCHSMRVTRHLPNKQIRFDHPLHGQKLEQVQSAQYLGITVTVNLDWGQHISEISSKATNTMGFLRRIRPWHLGSLGKLQTKHWFALSSSMQFCITVNRQTRKQQI